MVTRVHDYHPRVIAGFLDFGIALDGLTMRSRNLRQLRAVAGDERLPITIGVDNQEVVWVSSHVASADVATIERGKENTEQRRWSRGTFWAHVPTDEDYGAASGGAGLVMDQYLHARFIQSLEAGINYTAFTGGTHGSGSDITVDEDDATKICLMTAGWYVGWVRIRADVAAVAAEMLGDWAGVNPIAVFSDDRSFGIGTGRQYAYGILPGVYIPVGDEPAYVQVAVAAAADTSPTEIDGEVYLARAG